MATTFGGTPLWAPGDRDAFLAHRPDADPSRWPRGTAGQGLDRFVRDLLTARDRADCLGILWLHTEDDSKSKGMRDAETHAAAIKRHLALTRAAIVAGNREYEERFGHVYLIRAAGRSPDEMLAELRRRLGNDEDAERAEVVEQLAQITELRVRGLVS